jgi:ElaB/YqjD/DUF883 family membrane-anchored ribosome-binding protein
MRLALAVTAGPQGTFAHAAHYPGNHPFTYGVTGMTTASTASSTMRETASEAREGVRDIGKAANAASGNVQSDLQSLRDDFSRLAEQVGEIVANHGNAAWQRAKSGVDDVMSDAQDRGREAMGAVREVSDNFVDAIDDSLKNRPYTTLAIVAGLGFLFGVTWRR